MFKFSTKSHEQLINKWRENPDFVQAYNDLEEEGFITSRQGKGFFVMSSGSNLIREQLIQEVEKNLNSAILAAERASMTDEELIKLLRLLLEVNHE